MTAPRVLIVDDDSIVAGSVAELLAAGGYETRSGDDSDTYEAFAEYRYTFEGRSFTADRVGIASGADNIGSYQQEIGRNLQRAYANGDAILVWVNPEDPAQAIIDRGVQLALAAQVGKGGLVGPDPEAVGVAAGPLRGHRSERRLGELPFLRRRREVRR